MLDVVILENTLSISMDLRTNSWDYIALLVGYQSTTEHVRDSEQGTDKSRIHFHVITNTPAHPPKYLVAAHPPECLVAGYVIEETYMHFFQVDIHINVL